jgi:hypothetical protein
MFFKVDALTGISSSKSGNENTKSINENTTSGEISLFVAERIFFILLAGRKPRPL